MKKIMNNILLKISAPLITLMVAGIIVSVGYVVIKDSNRYYDAAMEFCEYHYSPNCPNGDTEMQKECEILRDRCMAGMNSAWAMNKISS